MNNKKGFVLLETIIVIVVISVSLLTLFSSYNKILTKSKTENRYDNSDYIYITKYLKNHPTTSFEDTDVQSIKTSDTFTNYTSKYNQNILDLYGIKKIYLLSNINDFANKEKYFDAYMIDYIKKLDVSDEESLFIVEYTKDDVDENYDTKIDTNSNELKKTYISSLRW